MIILYHNAKLNYYYYYFLNKDIKMSDNSEQNDKNDFEMSYNKNNNT